MHGDSPPEGTKGSRGRTAALTVGALGVVYGDIGTSPLYALRETFESHHHPLPVTEPNVLGVLSLVFWSLIVVITIKYLLFVMRADNHGEGGILALTSLASPEKPNKGGGGNLRPDGRVVGASGLVLLGLFGTALLYGDGMITPAISVLAAVEGVTVTAPGLANAVLPAAIIIIIGLFLIQPRGTASIGKVFGPVMVVWFSVLGVLGLLKVIGNPGVFPDAGYAGAADVLVTFDGTAAAYQVLDPQQSSNTWVYSKTNTAQAMLVHSADTCTAMQDAVKAANTARSNTGLVYATDQTTNRSADKLPTYWIKLLGTVDALNAGRTLPAC